MPGNDRQRIYFDSCVFIYLVERREPWQSRIRARLACFEKSPMDVVFTDLNRLECRTAPLAWNRPDMLSDYDAFFSTPGMLWRPLPTQVFDLATELRARYRLKTPDALHLATAVDAGCCEFWTNDQRLAQAAAGRIEILAFID